MRLAGAASTTRPVAVSTGRSRGLSSESVRLVRLRARGCSVRTWEQPPCGNRTNYIPRVARLRKRRIHPLVGDVYRCNKTNVTLGTLKESSSYINSPYTAMLATCSLLCCHAYTVQSAVSRRMRLTFAARSQVLRAALSPASQSLRLMTMLLAVAAKAELTPLIGPAKLSVKLCKTIARSPQHRDVPAVESQWRAARRPSLKPH